MDINLIWILIFILNRIFIVNCSLITNNSTILYPVEIHDSEGNIVNKMFEYDLNNRSIEINEIVIEFCISNNLSESFCHSLIKNLVTQILENKENFDLGIEIYHSLNEFNLLGRLYGTDKIYHHGYHRYYPRYIEPFKNIKNGGMFEIGIHSGRSLNMWKDYFPNAFIYGIDKDVESRDDKHEIFKVDQSNVEDVRVVIEEKVKHKLFLIVDDGSHVPEHQIKSFEYLFDKALQPGGCYTIEDIETSYWTNGNIYGNQMKYGYHHEKSIIEIFKALVDDINNEFLNDYNQKQQDSDMHIIKNHITKHTRQLISSITFGHNCIIIMKKMENEIKYSDREYRWNIFL